MHQSKMIILSQSFSASLEFVWRLRRGYLITPSQPVSQTVCSMRLNALITCWLDSSGGQISSSRVCVKKKLDNFRSNIQFAGFSWLGHREQLPITVSTNCARGSILFLWIELSSHWKFASEWKQPSEKIRIQTLYWPNNLHESLRNVNEKSMAATLVHMHFCRQ